MRILDRARLFVVDEEGQDLVEYGLLVSFIAIAAFVAVQLAGSSLNSLWKTIANQMASA